MKKIVAMFAALFAGALLFAADEYTVKSVTGTVTYEAEPGVMKKVTEGQKLSLSTFINTSTSSKLVVVDVDGKEVTIKAMKHGTVEKLSAAAGPAGKGISKGTVKQGTTEEAGASEKGTATASSRASKAKADYSWDD